MKNTKFKTVKATGTKGILIRDTDGEFSFRVKSKKGFIDYDICHSDLAVKILDEAEFYHFKNKNILDHSRETLGLKKVNSKRDVTHKISDKLVLDRKKKS